MKHPGENIAIPSVFHSSGRTLGIDPAERAQLVDAIRTTTDELRFSDALPNLSKISLISTRAGAKTPGVDISSISLDIDSPDKEDERVVIGVASSNSFDTATYIYEPRFKAWKVNRPFIDKQSHLNNDDVAAALAIRLDKSSNFEALLDSTDVSARDIIENLRDYLQTIHAKRNIQQVYQLSTRRNKTHHHTAEYKGETYEQAVRAGEGFDVGLEYTETNSRRRYKFAVAATYNTGIDLTKRYDYTFSTTGGERSNLGSGTVTIGSYDPVNEKELAAMAEADQFGYPAIDALYVGLNAMRKKHKLGTFRARLVA